jgi:hypothetical protein
VLLHIEEKTLVATYKLLLLKKTQKVKELKEEKLFVLDQKVGLAKEVELLGVDGTVNIINYVY